MKSEAEKRKIQFFMGVLVFAALVINSCFYRSNTVRQAFTEPPARLVPQAQPQSQQPRSDNREAAQKAAEDQAAQRAAQDARAEQERAAEHVKYLARYLETSMVRRPGVMTMGVAIASEQGKFNHAVNVAISARFKADAVETSSSIFTPEFVSDGLFSDAFEDSSKIIKKLELTNTLDVLLLARQQVEYEANPALENVISAHMHLEIMLTSVTQRDQTQTWTLSANGAGFTQKDARAQAEERLIKQIANDPKMSLNVISGNN